MSSPPGPELSDSELAGLCRRAPPHQDAWQIFWERFHSRVLEVVRWTLGSAADALAEDVVADVFGALVLRIRKFDESRASLATFVASVARSVALDALRRKHYRTEGVSLEEACVREPRTTPGESFPTDLLADLALAALERLGDAERRKILIQLLKNVPVAEIAGKFGRSETHVRRVRGEYLEALEAALGDLVPNDDQ